MNQRWIRVTKAHKCGICGKPDWCGYSEDGKFAICMRIESSRPAANGGWVHRLVPGVYAPIVEIPRKHEEKIHPVETEALKQVWIRWETDTTISQLEGLASDLGGLDWYSLFLIGTVWAKNYNAWAFPMRNGSDDIIGVRFRSPSDGKKWTLKGTHSGLFIPGGDVGTEELLYIVEGATDTATAAYLGLRAIGRPAALGCEGMILDYIGRHEVRKAVIISDNDTISSNYAGQRGSEKLSGILTIPHCILVPTAKDLRSFVKAGGTRDMLEAQVRNIVWVRNGKKEKAAAGRT